MSKLTKLEQETIITFNASEGTANIFSQDPAMIKKLSKVAKVSPDSELVDINVPKSWVTIKQR